MDEFLEVGPFEYSVRYAHGKHKERLFPSFPQTRLDFAKYNLANLRKLHLQHLVRRADSTLCPIFYVFLKR